MCYHTNAFKDGCRDCMHDFRIFSAPEIAKDGYEATYNKYKQAGYFK